MASRLFKQFLFSHVPMLTYIEGDVAFGATGSISTVKGSGISGVTRLNAGEYKVTFTDNFNRYLSSAFEFLAPTTGSDTSPSGLVPGTVYTITAVGTSDWATAGLPSGVTAATGLAFQAANAASGVTGTGTAKALGVSNVHSVEVLGSGSASIACEQPYIVLRTLGATASGNTTQVATSPASGSLMKMNFFFRNSSIRGQGE